MSENTVPPLEGLSEDSLNSTYILNLGCNLGQRMQNLERALNLLQDLGELQRVSSVFESKALLPEYCPPEWDSPFFNVSVSLQSDLSPLEILAKTKAIEVQMGRGEHPRWSPRVIDIDILSWSEGPFQSPELELPHRELQKRDFFIAPSREIDPSFALSKNLMNPKWMGIVNLTPDSFSDGGSFDQNQRLLEVFNSWWKAGVPWFDFGAESTRPGALAVSAAEQWERLRPAFASYREILGQKALKPKISVDTSSAEVAEKALAEGAAMINDVSGLSDLRFLSLLRASSCDYVLMHSLGAPVDPSKVIDSKFDVVEVLKNWFRDKLELLDRNQIDLDRIYLDPGIGFGKNQVQNYSVLKRISEFKDFKCKILVGHSRKSFLKNLIDSHPNERDIETLALSFNLAAEGVDVLRVHDPLLHQRFFRSWRQVQ